MLYFLFIFYGILKSSGGARNGGIGDAKRERERKKKKVKCGMR